MTNNATPERPDSFFSGQVASFATLTQHNRSPISARERSTGRRDDDGHQLQRGGRRPRPLLCVSGTTFNQPGTFNGIVTLTDNISGYDLHERQQHSTCREPSPIDMTDTATQGQPFSGQVASFRNSDPAQPLPGFHRDDRWEADDDGRPFRAADPNLYRLGSHTFNQPGTFNGTVTLTDNGSGPHPTNANSTFSVRDIRRST